MNTLFEYFPAKFGLCLREILAYRNLKAVEFRQLVLYTTNAISKNVFLKNYQHFLILYCVTRLLVFETAAPPMYDFCKEAWKMYVDLCVILYEEPFLSYNVHGLLHTVQNVQNLGSLETFSALSNILKLWYETIVRYWSSILVCRRISLH